MLELNSHFLIALCREPLLALDSLYFDGPGALALDAANTFAGGITIDYGTLDLAVAGAGGSGPITFAPGNSGEVAELNDTAGNWETVNGSNGTVDLRSARSSVTGGGDTLNFTGGAGNATSLYSTAGDWDLVSGSNGTVILNSAQATVIGGGDTISGAGSGNEASLLNTGGSWDLLNGSSATVYLTNAEATIIGGGDTINLSGSGDQASLLNTRGASDLVNGSNAIIYLTNAQATIANGNALMNLSGTNAFEFEATFGHDVVNGFGSTDTMDLSHLDFASWSALQAHMTQSGANTVITLDVSDSITLNNVTAASLTSSQFNFV